MCTASGTTSKGIHTQTKRDRSLLHARRGDGSDGPPGCDHARPCAAAGGEQAAARPPLARTREFEQQRRQLGRGKVWVYHSRPMCTTASPLYIPWAAPVWGLGRPGAISQEATETILVRSDGYRHHLVLTRRRDYTACAQLVCSQYVARDTPEFATPVCSQYEARVTPKFARPVSSQYVVRNAR